MVEVGSLKKVVYKFKRENDEELALEVGDIVQVIKELDKHWCLGICNGNEGSFPKSCTTDLKIPLLEEKQELFASFAKFTAEEDGDLSFDKGDLIIGLSARDENWWMGKRDANCGIFPLTFVWKIDRSRLPKVNFPRKMFKKAHVKMNFKAQLEKELDLVQDQIVTITEQMDELWYRGECNGKTGTFPSSYVTIISGDGSGDGEVVDGDVASGSLSQTSEILHSTVNEACSASNKYGYDCLNSGIAVRGKALFAYLSEHQDDLSFNKGDTVNLIKQIDEKWMKGEIDGRIGIFPRNHISIIVDCPGSSVQETYRSAFNCDTYGRILSDYDPDGSGVAKLSENETVTLIHKCDVDYYVVQTEEGKECTCPASIIEVIGQEPDLLPPSYTDVMEAHNKYKSFQNVSADVLNFNPSTRSDRSLSYPSAHFGMTPGEMNQSNFSFKSAPDVNNKIGENMSCLSSSFSTKINSSSRLPHRSLSLVEHNSTLETMKPNTTIHDNGRPVFKPSAYENLETTHFSTSSSSLGELCVGAGEANGRSKESSNCEAGALSQTKDAEKRAEERKKKIREQRNCIIVEILQTERDYKSDLEILYDTFVKDSELAKGKGVDVGVLFGNLDEVIHMSKQLVRRLEKVTNDSYANQIIGQCFIDISDEMKQVYGHYCRNHDEVNMILDKYDEKSAAGQYLKHKVELMKRQTNCFDLPSMLIKPVQRILKYPLLLNELVKYTEDTHVDKQSLIEAISLMTDVATAINEFKRRKDLVFKYRKHADTSFSERISKLNIHSVLKKGSRFGMRLSNTIGLTHVTKDENFAKLECQFHALEKSIKVFVKDVNVFTEKTEELIKTAFRMAEDISELYDEKKTQQEVDNFRSVHRIIATQYWEANKQILDRNVIHILRQLLQFFHGPNNLIQKRYDKLLDYEACSNKLEKNRDGTKVKMLQDNLLVAKNTYEALNSQLLDDLPKLYSKSVEILYDCISCFLKARKNFVGRSAKEMLSLTELPLLLGSHGSILDTFQVKHTLVTDNFLLMNIVPKQFFSLPNVSTLKRNSSPAISHLSFGMSAQNRVQQSPSDRLVLKSTYQVSQLYTACQDYEPADIVDLKLTKGDLVGVVKTQDPMGNKLKWFVDKGGTKGFVPAKVLQQNVASGELNEETCINSSHAKGNAIRPNSIYSSVPGNYPAVQQANLFTDLMDIHSSPIRKPHAIQPAPHIHSNGLTESKSPFPLVPPVFSITEQSSTNTSQNSEQTDSSHEPPHKYEEIDKILSLYDPVALEHAVQSSPSATALSLEEFDPYGPAKQHIQLYDNIPNCNEVTDSSSEHRYEEISEGTTEVSAVGTTAEMQYYFAMYDFSPAGVNQLKMTKGQVIRVVKKCDLNQNPEWWLVEDRYGKQGYVPANYLKDYPKEF